MEGDTLLMITLLIGKTPSRIGVKRDGRLSFKIYQKDLFLFVENRRLSNCADESTLYKMVI